MSRLQSERRRLYLPLATGDQDANPQASGLVDAQGRTRAMVLELARPADWDALSAVWHGVQVDLALPAPAIAVSGVDGYQLWFSLAEPLPATRASAFLEALRVRYLPGIGPERLRMLPAVTALAPLQFQHASLVPAPQAQAERWSAFVAPDLAPVFAETPWLDFPPSEHGQAELLSRLDSIAPADFQRAEARLSGQLTPSPDQPQPNQLELREASSRDTAPALDPKRFLLKVMNDDTVAMALRIEAAKALLPFFDAPRRP
ncbi:MAG: hypothetical protein HY019_18080 [Aquabacterium sp.]|uniref:hypothetical protein n=1 Tax=Aquabacterium sp. TaxID=1872578 RepID=UPI0025BC1303|nr:hypothetical protein [Aquabacterium sp.]MBI3383917.1 hypothetical protein [Aquabacterium sp.]